MFNSPSILMQIAGSFSTLHASNRFKLILNLHLWARFANNFLSKHLNRLSVGRRSENDHISNQRRRSISRW